MENTYHETDEEVESGDLLFRYETCTEPEDERDNVERHRLRQRIDQVTPQRNTVRVLQRLFQALAVNCAAVFLTGQRRNSTN